MTTPTPAPRPLSGRLGALLAGATLASSIPFISCATAKPPQQWDGLERRESKTLDNLYVRPSVQFKAYQRVRLDPVSVEFDKDWDPNQGSKSPSTRLSSSDIQQIRAELASVLRKVFADRLGQGGYPLVEEDGEDVLRVVASLVNVYINGPDKQAAGVTTYVMEAGHITLLMELRDSVSGQLLARVVDTEMGQDARHLRWAGSVANSAEAQQAFGGWANRLRKALDEVNGKAAAR
jgi:hypothetical protein